MIREGGRLTPSAFFSICRPCAEERDPEQVRRAVQAGEEILEKCVALGGSVTGEHGIGVEKADIMARQFTPDDLEAMKMLRRVFDPVQRGNPHKMFPGAKRCADFAPRKQGEGAGVRSSGPLGFNHRLGRVCLVPDRWHGWTTCPLTPALPPAGGEGVARRPRPPLGVLHPLKTARSR